MKGRTNNEGLSQIKFVVDLYHRTVCGKVRSRATSICGGRYCEAKFPFPRATNGQHRSVFNGVVKYGSIGRRLKTMGYTYNKVRGIDLTSLAQMVFVDFCATESAAQWHL